MAQIITLFGPKAQAGRSAMNDIVEVAALKGLLQSTMADWRGAPAPLRLAATHVHEHDRPNDRRCDPRAIWTSAKGGLRA